ncbi:MAG: YaaR family protein [Bacillus sp. (in: firmicutes)]
MKINQLPINLDKVSKEPVHRSLNQQPFAGLIRKQDEKMQMTALNRLMADIEGAGGRLARFRNFKDLAKYKSLVRRFIREAVEYGVDLNQSQSWNHFGQSRQLHIVKTIDEKLIQLADDLMNKEVDNVAILGQIGEIKGLLINLYT